MYKKSTFIRKMPFSLTNYVGIPGLEPGMTGPESVVLPLHHIPMLLFYQSFVINFPIAIAKVLLFFELQTISATFL